jgi:hypothetical protein
MERMSFTASPVESSKKSTQRRKCPESKSLDDDESWSTLSVNVLLLAQFRAGKGVGRIVGRR